MDKYPLPAYAVSMWVVGDDLLVAFPGVGTDKGHTIKLPASGQGLAAAIKIMRDRANAADLRIGQRGTPTQYDLEIIAKFMTSDAQVQRRKALAEAKANKSAEFKRREAAREAEKATSAVEVAEAIAFLEELGL